VDVARMEEMINLYLGRKTWREETTRKTYV